jgi:hypothetical protein
MDKQFLSHTIGAWKLAGHFDGLYYAFIDNNVDFDITPSRYPAVTIRRIESAYANRFIFDKPAPPSVSNNRYME